MFSIAAVRNFSLFGFILLLFTLFVSGSEHSHVRHQYYHRSHLRARENRTSETARDTIQEALAALAVANQKRLKDIHFNQNQFQNSSTQVGNERRLTPLNYASFDNSTSTHLKRGLSNTTADTVGSTSYSIPPELAEAARIVAESTPQSATPLEEIEKLENLLRKYERDVPDTNRPLQALATSDGLSGVIEVEPLRIFRNDSAVVKIKRADNVYWMTKVIQNGASPFAPSGYKVWRNVKDFGAVGDGVTDDTAAINLAISSGGRCGASCGSSTIYPAVVYFPQGTYLVSTSIIQYYNTQLLGDPINKPTILAASSFVGLGVITSDVYTGNGQEEWYINQNNFLRSIKNFRMDIRNTDPAAYICAIHWQVAQGTSLEHIDFYMSSEVGNTQQGIFMENGSGGFLSDLAFIGGNFGAYFGNQQFTTHHLVFSGCKTALQIHWDWAWEMQDIVIVNCTTGIIITGGAGGAGSTGQGVGSLILIDSVIAESSHGIVTSLHQENSTSLLLQNVGFLSVTTPIEDIVLSRVLLPGGQPTIIVDSWGFGMLTDGTGTRFMNGEHIPVMNRTSTLVGSFGYNDQKNLFTRGRPQYTNIGNTQVLNVKSIGAKGDGVSDDTAVLNSVLAIGANMSSIVFFPFGSYVITDTLRIPVGSRIVGQAWSQIMAKGAKFQDALNPRVAVQVGVDGDIGVIEIQDMMFTVSGPTAGAILVEWNVHESTQGSAGLWDTHIRVGGAIGSGLQKTECPKLTGSINPNCIAASLLMHLTPKSSAYIANSWIWVADHDLDVITQDQIDIYSARGVLIESQGPSWLYGTASEHNVMYQYQLSEAKNIVLGMIQTESPYFQTTPKAPLPFDIASSPFPNDPTFSHCPSDSITCAVSWAVRIIDSLTVYVLSAGLYSWFSKYSQVCLLSESCQDRGFEIENSDNIWIYNLATKAIVEMVSPVGETPTYAANNQNGFLSSVMGWVREPNTTIGQRNFEGYQLYKMDWLKDLPFGCKTALSQVIKCAKYTTTFSERRYRGSLRNSTLTDEICDPGCGVSLKSWFDNVSVACHGYNVTYAVPTKVGGTIWQGYNETCIKDTASGQYCNDIISRFTEVSDASQMPLAEICSECYVKKHQMMQQSAYSAYDDIFKVTLETINSRCSLTGPTSQPPSLIVRPVLPPPICASGLNYITSGNETCDSIALLANASSAALFMANTGTLRNCSSIPANLTLCLPIACSSTYILQSNDTCASIELQFGLKASGLRSLNPWLDSSCRSLHTAAEVYGSILCVMPQGGTLTATAPIPGITVEPSYQRGYAPYMSLPPPNATLATNTTRRCGKWHEASTGETCTVICTKEMIYLALFLEVNPSLNISDCTGSLVAGTTYCVGPVVGWQYDPIIDPEVPESSSSFSTSTIPACKTVSGLVSPTPSSAICEDGKDLYIHSANFGGQDVTLKVRDLISHNQTLSLDTANAVSVFGDPWPNNRKAILILYQYGSRPVELLVAAEGTGTVNIDPDVPVDLARTKFLYYDLPVVAVVWGIMEGQDGPGNRTKFQEIYTHRFYQATSAWLGFDGWPNVAKTCVVFIRDGDSFKCYSAREGELGVVL